VAGGFLAERGRLRRFAGELDVSACAALTAAPLCLLAVVAEWPALFLTASLLAPLAVFAFFPCLQTVIVEIVPPHRHGLAYAINVLFLGGVGTAMGPFIVGAASDVTGDLRTAMLLPVGGMIAAGVLIAMAGRVVRAHTPEHAARASLHGS
jgi:MFS family permease